MRLFFFSFLLSVSAISILKRALNEPPPTIASLKQFAQLHLMRLDARPTPTLDYPPVSVQLLNNADKLLHSVIIVIDFISKRNASLILQANINLAQEFEHIAERIMESTTAIIDTYFHLSTIGYQEGEEDLIRIKRSKSVEAEDATVALFFSVEILPNWNQYYEMFKASRNEWIEFQGKLSIEITAQLIRKVYNHLVNYRIVVQNKLDTIDEKSGLKFEFYSNWAELTEKTWMLFNGSNATTTNTLRMQGVPNVERIVKVIYTAMNWFKANRNMTETESFKEVLDGQSKEWSDCLGV